MAGSLNHMADKSGHWSTANLENGGDKFEALSECWNVIVELSGGDRERVNEALRKLNYPELASAPKTLLHTDWEQAYPSGRFGSLPGYRRKP